MNVLVTKNMSGANFHIPVLIKPGSFSTWNAKEQAPISGTGESRDTRP